jgi:hypothetical protein
MVGDPDIFRAAKLVIDSTATTLQSGLLVAPISSSRTAMSTAHWSGAGSWRRSRGCSAEGGRMKRLNLSPCVLALALALDSLCFGLFSHGFAVARQLTK